MKSSPNTTTTIADIMPSHIATVLYPDTSIAADSATFNIAEIVIVKTKIMLIINPRFSTNHLDRIVCVIAEPEITKPIPCKKAAMYIMYKLEENPMHIIRSPESIPPTEIRALNENFFMRVPRKKDASIAENAEIVAKSVTAVTEL